MTTASAQPISMRPFELLHEDVSEAVKMEASDTCQLHIEQIEDIYPCTPLQEGLIAMSMKTPGFYIAQAVYELHPSTDVARLQQAWEQTCQANAILRTRIIDIQSRGLFQVVLTCGDTSWETNQGFTRYKPMSPVLGSPLSQVQIVQEGSSTLFVLTIHHAICDRWSIHLLIEQLGRAFTGEKLPKQGFSQFIQHIGRVQDLETFWRSEVADIRSTQLFPDLPSPGYAVVPDQQLSFSIQTPSAADEELSLSTHIRLAWALALMSCTNCTTSVYGITLSGRNAPVPGIEQMAAPTIATVPLVTRLDRVQTVRDALKMVHKQSIRMIPYEQAGLQNIRRLSSDGEHACRFQTHLVVQPALADEPTGRFQARQQGSTIMGGFATYALELECFLSRDNSGFEMIATFDPSVISSNMVTLLCQSFQHNLQQTRLHPELTLDLLFKTLCPQHLQQLQNWNNSSYPALSSTTVHGAIDKRCSEQPHRPAVSSWDGELTYKQLNSLATIWAARLSRCGVKRGMKIPLCFHKSKWAPVAMLAVLKTGGSICYIDPSLPLLRIRSMCEDIGASVIVSSRSNEGLSESLSDQVVVIPQDDTQEDYKDLDLSHWRCPDVFSNDPLYTAFTSGSTGRPKGVTIEHGMYLASALAHAELIGIRPNSRALHFCSYSFDVSYLEQFSVLIAGACICIPTEEERQSNLAHAMARLNVDWAMLTPSVARVLSPRETVGLKTLVLIGEPVSASDVETWSDSVRLINTYGPAECSVVSSIRAPVRRDIHPSNIGYPCCSHWVVDPRNADRLMPIGAIGELLIEGPIVGTGYINAPEKSADAFIEPPSWLQSLRLDVPTRVYKTGDLVRYDPSGDGSLCFIGRKDNQVKLHGQRLELGDVEGHLRDCFPNARDIVAELIKPNHSSSTGPYLAAFVHHRDAHEGEGKLLAPPNASFHRDVESAMVTLRQRLPSFMIPHIFLPVKQIPRTTNGKVSRRELQMALASLPSTTLEPYRSDRKPKSAPSTSREEALRRIWAVHVSMQPEQIGVDDNVFHLGADSITAMHVVTAARQEKLQLTVADIFRYPNIREMSLRLQAFCDDTSSVPPPLSLLLENDEPVDNILASCAQECQIHQDDIEDVYSCTPLQDALFVGAAVGQRRKNRPTYVAQWEYSLHQNINRDQLQEAWEYIYRANPVLRTRFVQLAGGSLYQVVVREAGRWETWCGRDEYSQALGSMVLGQPLVRLAWVQDGKTQKLVLTMHHAVYDAWSIPQLWSQVENAYHNRTAPVVPTPFASFVRYVRSGQNIEASRDFWVSQFADLEAVVFPSMSLGSYEPSATKDLQKMVQLGQSTSHEFTQSTLIRLAWAFVQSQYQCTSDVVFGVTLSGRHAPIPGIEAMTGPTIATIPWRAIVHSNRPIRELLEQVQRQASEIIPHEQMGIHNIRKMSSYAERACSFQTLLVVQTGTNSSSMASTILDGVESTVGACDFCTHSLTIVCNLVQGGIQIQMLFDPTIISGSRVGNILGQFAYILQLLHDSNTNFERRLQDFPLISPQDISVLNHWNRDLPATVNHCAHELFRKRCFEAPNAPAVSAWDGKWTYSELDVTSSALAKALVQQGVEREMFVPVCMAKSRWVIAAMLAILKAGAAFVLLDPTHPVQRLQTICESIGAEVVVTSHQYLGLGKSLAPQCFVLDEQQLSSLGNISHDDFPALSPSSAIYAVFTSGSTGTPKGVVIEHRSFCSAALAYLPQLGIAPGARVLHFASYAFDVSIMETLATLVGGGCICILSDSQRLNGFCEAATSLGVTHALLPPSLIRSLSPSELRTIKTLVLGGEKMAAADIDNWSREVRLINAYGPAECAINTLLRANITASVDAANLGFGTGVVCWVTDPDNVEQLVPLGGVGELILEGPAVGRGYLKDLEKTAAAFIDTPSWLLTLRGNHPGRLYRTGDLVRYVDDGSLVYVGRKDSQVKLRGQRIDLGEVESYLRHNFNAQDVAAEVIIPQFLPSAPLLAAFVLFAADARKGDRESLSVLGNPNATFHQEVEAATTKLHQLLPKYMIPTRYFPLNRMPRLPSGKIDRRCLQQSVAILSAAEMEQFQPMASEKRDPSTNAERILQRIWAEVLSQPLDKIGVDDSFFHLGGDSIGVMKMAAMAREQGVQISVADVFAQPELNSLAFSSQSQSALAISQPRRWEPFSLSGVNDLHAFSKRLSAQGIVLADPDEIEDIIPVSESQSLFLRRDVLHYFSFVLEGCLDISRLQAALRAVTNKYSILRTCFIPQGHSYLQIVRRSIPLPFTHVVGHADIMNTCSDIWKKDSATWNVVREVPFQLILVSESASPTRHALLIRLLHAQWDGVSLPYLFRDIEEAYKGHTIRPVSSFGDFLYAREIKKSAATFSFWREFLHGASMVTLPSSLKCPKTPADDPATVWVMKELQSPRSPPPGITMATVVKAAFSLVMSNLIKQTDFVFGQTVNSRSFSLDDIDKILGPCLNLIPFRIQLEDGWKVKDLLDHVQQQHTLTMAHDYLDFGDIVDKCTDWSPETKFSCILQHQNIERNHHLALDESIRSDFKLFPRFRPLSELWIFSVPEASSLAIEVCTRSCTLSQESATLLAEVLCMAVEQLLRCPNGSMCDSVLAIQAKMLNFPTYFSTQR
ncbi:nonribosomal peptide synthase [Penicillium soppii]|uniref:nonribosomal peptide synthase n=1 Tax=Penicillium soppii TaxID=69789 RepID=UPI002547920A|nr:nonribosomal peptide synthase [Penicillium soppii]KAJ5871119.1 nonribosomal peptide synthase [Penicillium soppii]